MIYYDKKPSVLETEHNGMTRYRFNIESYEQQDEQTGTHTSWRCEEVIVYAPLSSNKLLAQCLTRSTAMTYEQSW